MKVTLNRISRIALMWVMVCAFSVPAFSQVKFGLRGGVDLNSLDIKNVDVSSSNRVGFFVGPTVRVSTPMFLSVDGSLLYSHRSLKGVDGDSHSMSTLNLPINARAGVNLLGVGAFLSAGPQFAFNLGSSSLGAIKDAGGDIYHMDLKKTNLSLNFGAGVHVSHFEAGIYYNLPLGKTAEFNLVDATGDFIGHHSSKMKTWSLALTYYL